MNAKTLAWTKFGLLFLSVPAFAAPEPKSIPWEETGPFKHVDGTGTHRNNHNMLLNLRNQANAASGRASSIDIGDVAVIVDDGSIVIQAAPASPFDLATPTALNFAADTDEFVVSFAAAGLDGTFGANLGLGDDDTTAVSFPAGLPFLGSTYTTVHVNSDGNVTFGIGDSASTARDAARHVGGPPRISPLLVDLDPTAGGSVHADVRSDRVVVTWDGVPEFGISNSNTFQLVLHDTGDIDVVYHNIDATFAVVGVAEGNGEGPINEIDLTEDLPGTFGAGAIFEEFNPAIPAPQVDIVTLSNKFYETHEDKYDFLVVFTDFVIDLQGAFAFLAPVKNETLGLGGAFVPGFGDIFDNSEVFGSGGELEAFVMMNRIGLYWPDAKKLVDPPIRKFRFSATVPGATLDGPPGADQFSRRARRFGTLQGDFGFHGAFTLGLNSAMSLMAQEAGHRWLAYPAFVHPTKGIVLPDAADLLGRQLAHWSFFFNVRVPDSQFAGDPRASGEEGNAIIDLGPDAFGGQLPVPCNRPGESTFLTEPDELIDGYTELDQYFMGLRRDEDVGGFWYVDEPRSAFTGDSLEPGFPPAGVATSAAQDDIIFCGMRVDLTVQNIQDLGNFLGFPPNGPRIPEIGDEVDADSDGNPAVDVKTMAFILLFQNEPGIRQSSISQVDNFRRTWQEYANGAATGGLGRFDSSLDPVIH